VPGVLGENQPQLRFAEDQHPVGDLGPGGEDEPFGVSVRARTVRGDLRCRDAGAGRARVEGVGELPGAVADQEPEVRGPVTKVHEVADNPVEADHGRLKARVRPMRGLKRHHSARILAAGHAFVQNLRRGYYDIATEVPSHHWLRVAFDDLALTI
jgi:hypothetical protein